LRGFFSRFDLNENLPVGQYIEPSCAIECSWNHEGFQLKTPLPRVTPLDVLEKLKTLDQLKVITAEARINGKVVVFTNGCFDLLHRGHVHLLREAKALGDILIVAINSDKSVKSIKGPTRPVLSETDRLDLIAAMEMVDYLVLFDQPDPTLIISALAPDILVKGGDWPAEEVIGANIVRNRGGKVVSIPYLQGYSTTKIIEKIRS
jgi:rfaE bifunctional protein nucleotidyltransferase chain/domain